MPGLAGAAAVSRIVATHHNGSNLVPGRRLSTNPLFHNNNNTIVNVESAAGGAAEQSSRWGYPASAANQSKANGTAAQSLDHQAKQISAYRRWLNRKNRVGPEEESAQKRPPQLAAARSGPKYQETPGASAILYLGIGMVFVGTVITVVGVGDDNFQDFGLRMIGPALIAAGVIVCAIRILVCACAGRCQLCDRHIETTGQKSAGSTVRSWRPDSRSVISGGGTRPSSANAAALLRQLPRIVPTSALVRLTSEHGGGESPPKPSAPPLSPSAASSASSFDSGSFAMDTPPGTTLSDDDIGSLSEFQEVELKNIPEKDGNAFVNEDWDDEDDDGAPAPAAPPAAASKGLDKGVILSATKLNDLDKHNKVQSPPIGDDFSIKSVLTLK